MMKNQSFEVKSNGITMALTLQRYPTIPFQHDTQNISFQEAVDFLNSHQQNEFRALYKNESYVYSGIPATVLIQVRNIKSQYLTNVSLSIDVTNNSESIFQQLVDLIDNLGPSCTHSTSFTFTPSSIGKLKVALKLIFGPPQSKSNVFLTGCFDVRSAITLISSINTESDQLIALLRIENCSTFHAFNVTAKPIDESPIPIVSLLSPKDVINSFITLSHPQPSITISWDVFFGSRCQHTFFLPMPRKEFRKPLKIIINSFPTDISTLCPFTPDIVIKNQSGGKISVSLSIECSKSSLAVLGNSKFDYGIIDQNYEGKLQFQLVALNEGKLSFPKLNFTINGKPFLYSPQVFISVVGFPNDT